MDYPSKDSTKPSENAQKKTHAKLIIVSHGETMNDIFPQWLRLAFEGEENYQPYDLNMPATIPKRPLNHYQYDPPLTEYGSLTAEFVGKGIKLAGYQVNEIFSSPELRCIQTAAAIARAIVELQPKICVEPALADWVQLTPETSSNKYLCIDELTSLGYPISKHYKPYLEKPPKSESPSDYLRRLSTFFSELSTRSQRVSVIVANSNVLEIPRNNTWSTAEQICQVKKMSRNCDTCEVEIESGKMHISEPLMLPFTKTLKEVNEALVD